jgi:hypothetical protein
LISNDYNPIPFRNIKLNNAEWRLPQNLILSNGFLICREYEQIFENITFVLNRQLMIEGLTVLHNWSTPFVSHLVDETDGSFFQQKTQRLVDLDNKMIGNCLIASRLS